VAGIIDQLSKRFDRSDLNIGESAIDSSASAGQPEQAESMNTSVVEPEVIETSNSSLHRLFFIRLKTDCAFSSLSSNQVRPVHVDEDLFNA